MAVMTDDMIRELCVLTTRDHAGRHFTEWSQFYNELEELGLVKIFGRVHTKGGVTTHFSQQEWIVEITDDGQEIVDSHPELHPE